MKNAKIYTSLAPLYDLLMSEVDYDAWADYIDEIIQYHHEYPTEILELACGTGTLAISLDEFGYYDITATDASEEMLKIATDKARNALCSIEFRKMNYNNIDIKETFDVVFTVFDSINYLSDKKAILKLLKDCYPLLNNNGLFIFDFSTPKNSLEAVDYLDNDEASNDSFRYYRTSRYDDAAKIHYNEFTIEQFGDDAKTVINRFKEVHKQHIYTLEEILDIVKESPYHLEAAYDDFDLVEANDETARVTVVLKCQKT